MERKRIIITGASSGIGQAAACLFMARGWTVGLAARRGERLREMADGQSHAHWCVCDVCAPDGGVSALQALREEMGGMDVLLHCAGVGKMNGELDFSGELPAIETNVRGWTAVADWAFAVFVRQGSGHLAAVTSIAAVRGLAPAPAYSASKAYQAHYLEALRQRARGVVGRVRVTDIRPGFVCTPLLAHPEKFFWVMPVEKVAQGIVKVVERPRGVVTVTWRWKLIVPLLRLAPTALLARVVGCC